MAEPVMLREEDVGRIGDYVKPWLRELVDGMVPQAETVGVGSALLERMVRVEEELKAQRELMAERFGFVEQRFEASERRFDDLIAHLDKRFDAVDGRFEAVDKRFDALLAHSDKRFDAVDKRFEEMRADSDRRFEAVDRRFEAVDRRFEEMRAESDKHFCAVETRFQEQRADSDRRFGAVHTRFEDLIRHTDRRFNTLTWMIGAGFVVITSLTTVFALLA